MRKLYLPACMLILYSAVFGQTLPTDYFRSATFTPSDWNLPSTWESSPTGAAGTWVPASQSPTSAANTISILLGHIVILSTNVSADQLVLEVGAGLRNEMIAGNTFTITDGPGDDMLIKFGAFYRVNTTESYSSHIIISSGAIIHIESGGTIEIGSSATGATTYASTSGSFDWDDGAIFAWATTSVPDIERTFFPAALASEAPIFRFTFPISSMGGSSVTRINGRLESSVNLGLTGTGLKYFRNGIRFLSPNLTIDGSASGKFIIDGITAELGGLAGNIIAPSAGIDIGDGSGTTVTMTSTLFTITGNINLIGANSIIVLLDYGLTVTGIFQLTQKTSYVKTNGTGKLTMTGVSSGSSGKLFPIGLSTINPLYVNTTGSHTYSARVVEPITPPIYNDQQAVLRTWYISSSTAPTGTDVSFGYSYPGDTGPFYSNAGPVQIGVYISTWNIHESNLTPGTFILVPGTFIVTSTVSMSYFATSGEFPFVIANNGAILSNDCIIHARAQKISGRSMISWNINSCAQVTSFSVERSVNNGRFETAATILPGTALHYEWMDPMTAFGINTYRVRVNRISGGVKYSNIVAVIHDSKGLLITSVSPNPLEDRSVIRLTTARKGVVKFRLVKNTGAIVRQWSAEVAEGSNAISFSPGSLAGGVYYLQVSGLDGYHQYRLIK